MLPQDRMGAVSKGLKTTYEYRVYVDISNFIWLHLVLQKHTIILLTVKHIYNVLMRMSAVSVARVAAAMEVYCFEKAEE